MTRHIALVASVWLLAACPKSAAPECLEGATGSGCATTDAGMDDASIDACTTPLCQGPEPEPWDGGDGSPPDAHVAPATCSESDVSAWRDAHLKEGLVEHFFGCAANPTCGDSSCSFTECISKAAGVSTCQECVDSEISCLLSSCRDECGVAGSNRECRSCACTAGCADAFSRCASQPLDVCVRCEPDDPSCAQPLSPALIIAILG